ncbi:MAG TPA: glycosyltransferase family 1 protein [Sumerlaeia bacterium]|nr:glycosyltransferase family 1 protein [Sumerlaeia bacterium]
MRIVVDARGIRAGMTGVGHYTARLVSELGAARPDDAFVFLGLRGEEAALRSRVPSRAPNVDWREIDVDPESHPRGDWWMHRVLPGLLDELGANVFHGPAYVVPFGRRRPRAACVVTIHDLTAFTHPRAYPLKFRVYLRHAISRSIAVAEYVVFDSDFVRREALERFSSLGEDKTAVIALAPAPCFRPAAGDEDLPALRRRHGLPESYILMVGTLETRKNPEFFLRLSEELERRLGSRAPSVVWAGSLGTAGRSALQIFGGLERAGRFRFLDLRASDVLPVAYQCAEVLAYPSLSEGFGLPVIEAMACGLPVVAADASCLPEVVGDGGQVLPLDRVGLWGETIEGLLLDPARRTEARQRALAWVARFSWKRTAQETARVYERAARG